MRTKLLSALTLVLMGTTSVTAADLYNGRRGSIKDAPAVYEPAAQSRPTFYLRADATYSHNMISSLFEPPNYELSNIGIGTNWAYGFGVGMYFSKQLRGDITIDLRQHADIYGTVADTAATFQGERRFGVKSNVYLANLYYDFDMRSHFTPYVGIGLGFSQNRTSDGVIMTPGCGPALGCDPGFAGAKQTSAAAALMAGFTAKLHDRLSLDAGYRFLYLGDAHTGNIVNRSPLAVAPQSAADPIVSDMHAHEFRVGLRMDIR